LSSRIELRKLLQIKPDINDLGRKTDVENLGDKTMYGDLKILFMKLITYMQF